MKVELVFGVVLSPGYFFKPVRLCVDEFCVLWNWLIRISEREKNKNNILSKGFNSKPIQ